MAKIIIKEPDGPYSASLNTGSMAVEIRKAHLGVIFITEDGNTLSVCMCDGDFEITKGVINNVKT